MRRRLIVLGTSGLAKEVAMFAEQINAREHRWDIAGFVGDSAAEVGRDLGIARVLGDDDWLLAQDFEADLVVGIGYPRVRAKVVDRYLRSEGRFVFPNIIHPSAVFDLRRVELGRGNVVTAGCLFTCDIEVGDFNYFNLGVTVGHDTQVGSFCVLNPSVNVSGGVRMGDRVLAGTGSQILENLAIGPDATIGAGAVVNREVAAGDTVAGVPAKPLPRRT